jgi:hypothetical protein
MPEAEENAEEDDMGNEAIIGEEEEAPFIMRIAKSKESS